VIEERRSQQVVSSDERLEQFVGGLARTQPLVRAPSSLERRVLAQLALQRVDMPWWRRGFAHWPLPARAAFLLASFGFLRLAVGAVMSVVSFVDSWGVTGTALSWVHEGGRAAAVTASVGSSVLHAIPSEWLYAAAAGGFVLYALLFGLGAVAYRTLYAER
jgi:hypothetical protein